MHIIDPNTDIPLAQGRQFLKIVDPIHGLDGGEHSADAFLGAVLSAMAGATDAGLERDVILDRLEAAADAIHDYTRC